MATSRDFGKMPTKDYKPGFIDIVNPETMKMSIDRELGEISKAFYQTDEKSATKDNSIYKGKWNPVSGKYPDSGYENSWWDVETVDDKDYSFDGKVWRSFQKLIYDQGLRSYRQVEDWASAIIKERIERLEVNSGQSSAAIQELHRIMVDADRALAERITNLNAHVDSQDAKTDAKIEDYNKVLTDANSALANKVTTVEASYKAADSALSSAIDKETSDRDAAINVVKASVTSEATARANADTALGSKIDTVKSELNGNIASVQQYASTEITKTNDSLTSTENSLNGKITTVDGKVTNVDNKVNTVDGKVATISAKWGVTVDVNGNVAGIELNNGTSGSEFRIRADKFFFTDATTNLRPFKIEGGTVYMDNVNVRGTVYAERIEGDVGTVFTWDEGNRYFTQDNPLIIKNITIRNRRPYDRELLLFLGNINSEIGSENFSIRVISGNIQIVSSSVNSFEKRPVQAVVRVRIPANTTNVYTAKILPSSFGGKGFFTGGVCFGMLTKYSDEVSVA